MRPPPHLLSSRSILEVISILVVFFYFFPIWLWDIKFSFSMFLCSYASPLCTYVSFLLSSRSIHKVTSVLVPNPSFSLFGVGASNFHLPYSSILCLFSLYSCFLRVFFNTSFHFSFRSTLVLIFISSVSPYYHLQCSDYYIFVCLSRHMS